MKPSSAGVRRHPPASPFNVPVAVRPEKRFELEDRVTHDQYGLGTVIGVEDEVAVLVDFRSRQVRITRPYAKLTRL